MQADFGSGHGFGRGDASRRGDESRPLHIIRLRKVCASGMPALPFVLPVV